MIRKSFFAVVLAAIAIFAFSTAQASQIDGLANFAGPASPTVINVNPGNLGDALIYGYYNARGSYNYFRVVNTSTSYGVGVKVRFREGKNSNEVFDMFVCLSAADQWSGWVIDDGNSNNPAGLIWYDSDTPTFPDPQLNNDVTDNLAAGQPFHYSSTGAAASVTADDTKEGYFEIIGVAAWADTPGSGKVVKTPNACGETLLGTQVVDQIGFTPPSLVDVPNVVMGNSYIFNVAAGQGTFAYNATALSDFRNTPVLNAGLGTDDPPTLADASEGLVAVNYILTKAHEMSIYDISDFLSGTTDIINTFPTKRLSIINDPPDGPNGPFNDAATIDADGKIVNAIARCETVAVRVWDDQEQTPGSSLGFSPPPPSQSLQKCDEVSYMVVGLSNSPMLDTNLQQFNINDNGFQFGWIDIDLTTVAGRTTTVSGQTTTGLPVMSYELQGFIDGFFTHMLPLRYTSQIIGTVGTVVP